MSEAIHAHYCGLCHTAFVCECDDVEPGASRICDDCLDDPPEIDEELEFAEPGGNSALRAATPNNPRNLPCPTCHKSNRLTPKDKALGYQCDACADLLENGRGW